MILASFAKTNAGGYPDLESQLAIDAAVPGSQKARQLAAMFSDAKQRHKFPKGVGYFCFGAFETEDVASFINANLEEQIAGREKQNAIAAEADRKALAEKQAKRTAVIEAIKAVRTAEMQLNSADANVRRDKSLVSDGKANFKATKADSHKTELANAEASFSKSTEAQTKAREALDAAREALAKLQSPDATPSPIPQFTL